MNLSMKKQAMFYEKLKDKIHCYLCPHNCVIGDGHIGKCNVISHMFKAKDAAKKYLNRVKLGNI